MFEDSMLESGGKLKSSARYWMWATFSFWAVVLAILILIPLLFPEALPKGSLTASLTAPPQLRTPTPSAWWWLAVP